MFIVRHNLKVGSKYGRNPPLEHAGLVMLAQTASLYRGAVSETAQLEFVSKLLAAPLSAPQHRSITDHDFAFEQWGQLVETDRSDTAALDLNLHRAHDHSATIKELLAKQAVFSSTSCLPKAAFFNSLCLNELEYEAAAGFSAEELTLLKLLRSE
ncbi:hypothetical protein PI124_g22184 [Phytophthora idaei]|nr:hypothetical protein PI125_g21481 [Phytophthora idaei]KAG3127063.1 hypothetical protein PI126_g22032 [Phytophthora idaei]KAG3232737.1 hypothetical protein PI124_g22184 [Phytophthora idaei]